MFVCSLSLTRENWIETISHKGNIETVNNFPARSKNTWRTINTMASIWWENVLVYRGVLRYYQFLVIHSLPQASQNRSCLWTNIRAYFLCQMKAIINLNYKNVAGEWTPRYHGQKFFFSTGLFVSFCIYYHQFGEVWLKQEDLILSTLPVLWYTSQGRYFVPILSVKCCVINSE